MKLRYRALSALLLCSGMAMANKTVTVKQVTQDVTITEDVDYVISEAEPFAQGATVNIENTEHAVLIIQGVKPSLVLSRGLLDNVLINGEKAVDGKNCQVRLYTHGTIIFPYAKTLKPLTVYAGQDCTGESCNNFGLENSGGYMNNMTAAKLNNRVRSFVLKRGYMVTFAVGQGGWGYSRCFIAQDEDLVFNTLPAILDERISSYRVFEWVYAQKKGLASDANAGRNAQLGTCWTYDWAQGNSSLLPDVEWVPNHIYEDWPSSSSIGGRTGTCHTKNNNEPANNSDDHPQSVETVLGNWQNMMRTGLRLCSPATHDGGWGWHNQFMDEIDKRGWRCDVVDFHGYWNSGTWGSLDWMIDTYAHGRPVWFSEWLWGSSWGKQGIFADGAAPDGVGSFSARNQQACYNGTKPILDRLNANERVERYAYWNGENVASRLIHDGQLSVLGKYYASMNTPIAYRKSREFIPKEPAVAAATDLSCTFNRKTGIVTLTWTEASGDLVTSITLQRKDPGATTWENLCTIAPKDQNSAAGVKVTASDTLTGAAPGEYEYRVKDVAYNKKSVTSNTASVSISSQQSAGNFVFGSANVPTPIDMSSATTIANTAVYADLEGMEAAPLAFLGLPSYNNKQVGVTSFLNTVSKTQMRFGAMLWREGFTGSYAKSETMDYMVIPEGTYFYGDMQVVVGKVTAGGTDVDVAFATPFPEGETPVVICQPYLTSSKYGTVPRVSEVTGTGFKVHQAAQSTQGSITKRAIYYIAASKGQACLEGGYILSAGTSSKPVGGRSGVATQIAFEDVQGDTLRLSSPTILCGPQTDCLPAVASTFRINSTVKSQGTAADGSTFQAVHGMGVIRQVDASNAQASTSSSSNADTMGWICLSIDMDNVDAIHTVLPSGSSRRTVYSLDGKRVTGGRLTPGIYIVSEGGMTRKVAVK